MPDVGIPLSIMPVAGGRGLPRRFAPRNDILSLWDCRSLKGLRNDTIIIAFQTVKTFSSHTVLL